MELPMPTFAELPPPSEVLPATTTVNKTPEQELLEFNLNGVLENLLAIQEHMTQLGKSNIADSWCIRKHTLLAKGHHIKELVNHSANISPELNEKAKLFMTEFDTVFKPVLDVGNWKCSGVAAPEAWPSIDQVHKLRNRFREIFGDRTLDGDCPLCSMDKIGTGVTSK